MSARARRWLPVVGLGLAILAMSGPWASSTATGSWTSPWLLALGAPPWLADLLHAGLRKSGHVLAYASFGVLALRAAREGGARAWRPAGRGALLLAAGLAVADESLQSLSSARGGSPWDVLLDGAGALLGIALAARVSARARGGPE